jgi:DNA polymerase III delta subunit
MSKGPRLISLTGSSEFRKETFITKAIKKLEPTGYQVVSLRGAVDSSEYIREHLFSAPLIPVKKLITIRAANKVDPNEVIKSYCNQPDLSNVVILCSSGKVAKWFKDLPVDLTVPCDDLKPWEYKDWIVEFCSSKGYTIDAKYAEAVHANIGNDMYLIANEMEKIFISMGDRTTITRGDLTSSLVRHQDPRIFDIAKTWSVHNYEAAARELHYLLDTKPGGAIPMVAVLQKKILDLLRFLSYRENNLFKKDICSLMGISFFAYNELEAASLKWKSWQLRKAFQGICDVDIRVKQGQDASLLLHHFLRSPF